MHDEFDELFLLLLEVEQVVPLLLDLGLESLEPHEAADPDDQFRLQDGFPQEIVPVGPKGLGLDVWALIGSQEDDGQR